MRIIAIACFMLCTTAAFAQDHFARPGAYNHRPHTPKPLPAGREASIRAIANTYSLHMTPEATALQLSDNATTLTKLLAWVNTQSTLTAPQKQDMLDAIARLQAENTELLARAAAPSAPSIQDQRKALLPPTLQ